LADKCVARTERPSRDKNVLKKVWGIVFPDLYCLLSHCVSASTIPKCCVIAVYRYRGAASQKSGLCSWYTCSSTWCKLPGPNVACDFI